MSIEKPSPFCPNDCVFLKEKDEVFHRGCGHMEDVVVNPPVEGETITKPVRKVKIVGANPRDFYAKVEGQSGISIIFKEGIKLRKD